MPSAAASAVDTNAIHDALKSAALRPSTNYLCTSCQISFPNGQDQRMHMKEPWHVENVRRRMASLPPVSPQAPTDHIQKKPEMSTTAAASSSNIRSRSLSNSNNEASDEDNEQTVSIYHCLFCSEAFADDDEGFTANLEHMHAIHGMFIPNPGSVSDLQSFVGYLATEVRVWHECLYCGATKPSNRSVQSHMRDKGHCLLNFDREPELLDFWEPAEGAEGDERTITEPPTNLSATEIRFASGRVISSRHAPPETRRSPRARGVAASTMRSLPWQPGEEEPSPPTIDVQLASGRQLARREELGILGVSVQQRQALAVAEKKAQRSEAISLRAREWVYARGANSQKFDQLDNQMKWGKQNHKLLPR